MNIGVIVIKPEPITFPISDIPPPITCAPCRYKEFLAGQWHGDHPMRGGLGEQNPWAAYPRLERGTVEVVLLDRVEEFFIRLRSDVTPEMWEACRCQEFGHPMRPGRIRGVDHRVGRVE